METLRTSRIAKKSLMTYLILALCSVSCETTGGSTALGSVLGAGLGGVIGHQSGHAAEGALIGGCIGGSLGIIIHKAQEQQLASRADVEEEYRAKGVDISSEPYVEIEELVASPQSVQPGETVSVEGRYVAMGADDPKPEGKFRILKENEQVAESKLEISNTGRSEFTKKISVPKGFAEGEYECEVTIEQGDSLQVKRAPFEVASSS